MAKKMKAATKTVTEKNPRETRKQKREREQASREAGLGNQAWERGESIPCGKAASE